MEDLDEAVLCPSNLDILCVKRILYFPGSSLTASDLVRGRRLDPSLIQRTMELIGLAGFGEISYNPSQSNRNRGVICSLNQLGKCIKACKIQF